MPTGYTASIGQGQTFEQFVWGCARAMGALIMMREEPSGTPIPERFEPSDFHAIRLSVAKQQREKIVGMSIDAAGASAKEEYEMDSASSRAMAAEQTALRSKYEDMIEKVRAWVAPTDDHANFQVFMLEQLTTSLQWDCGHEYVATVPDLLTGAQWKGKKLADIEKNIAYHTRMHDEEVDLTEKRNVWIKALRDSLTKVAA